MSNKNVLASLLAAVTAVGMTAVITSAGAAQAAATSCSAGANQIYNSPASITGANGTLLACRSVTLSEVPDNVAMKAWQVQYASTDVSGSKVAVSGTLAVPTAAWTGGGTRPIVAFNPGTLGLGPQCAFSKQLAGAYQDEYEGDQIAAFLKAGFAVAATDGIGYLNGQTHPYVVGADAGHAVLDMARTASQVPTAGLSSTTKVVLDGYSEGGQASLWAAQLAASYAPNLNVVGAAAGGVPGQLRVVGAQLDGSAFAGFLVDAVEGVIAAHPSFPVAPLENAKGSAALAQAKTLCLLGTLSAFAGAHIEDYTTNGLSLSQLYNIADPSGYTVGQFLDASQLGVNIGRPGSGAKYTIGFPVYQYRGLADEIVSTSAEDATASAYCHSGITTDYDPNYLGDHLLTDNQAIGDVVTYLTNRVKGLSAPSTC